MTSVIYLKDLIIEAKHGVHEHEKQNAQRFKVSVELSFDISKASATDDLGDTLDWSGLRKNIINTVEGNSFNLIESLSRQVADDILASDNRIQKVLVSIDKLDAFKNGVPGVSIEVSRS